MTGSIRDHSNEKHSIEALDCVLRTNKYREGKNSYMAKYLSAWKITVVRNVTFFNPFDGRNATLILFLRKEPKYD